LIIIIAVKGISVVVKPGVITLHINTAHYAVKGISVVVKPGVITLQTLHYATNCVLFYISSLQNSPEISADYLFNDRPLLQLLHAGLCCCKTETSQTRMSANAQRNGLPAEYRWRPLFNTAKFG